MQEELAKSTDEKQSLVQGNLAKLRRLAQIRADPSTANTDFDDPALAVLDPKAVKSATGLRGPVESIGTEDTVSKEIYDDLQGELDEVRKKLLDRTEEMTTEINQLKPLADQVPALLDAKDALEELSQGQAYTSKLSNQSLGIKTIQGRLISWYRSECARLFGRWVRVLNDSRLTIYSEVAKRADNRLVSLEKLNVKLETTAAVLQRERARERGHHMMSRWWATSAEWSFGRWQKSVCLRRITVSMQDSFAPVVGKAILSGNDLEKSAEEMTLALLEDPSFKKDHKKLQMKDLQVLKDAKVLMDASETTMRHAVRLDNHGRSLEAASLLSCLDRSCAFHDDVSNAELSSKIKQLQEHLSSDDTLAGLNSRAKRASGTRNEIASSDWKESHKNQLVRSYIKHTITSSFVSVKVEGLVNTRLASILLTLMDIEQYLKWMPLLQNAQLDEEIDIFRRDASVEFVAPGPYANRKAKVNIAVVDDLANESVYISAESSKEDSSEETEIYVKHFGAMLKPITPTQTVVRMVLVADFKLANGYVPPTIPQFIADKVVNGLFDNIKKASRDTDKRSSQKSSIGKLWGLHSYIDTRVNEYIERTAEETGAVASELKHVDEVEILHTEVSSEDMDMVQELSDSLLHDLQFMINDFDLSEAASAILNDAQGSDLVDGFNFVAPPAPQVTTPAPAVTKGVTVDDQLSMGAARTSVLATLSKARQRSKILTVAASCRRTKRGGTGTITKARRDQTATDATVPDSSNEQKHYLIFTSTFADEVSVKSQTDRIIMILNARKLKFDLVDLYQDPDIRQDMEELSGDSNTLPQLFIDGDYLVEGLDELQYLHDNDMIY